MMGRCRILVQDHHHVSAAWADLGRQLQGRKRGSPARGRLFLLNGRPETGGGGVLEASATVTTAGSSSTGTRNDSVLRGWGWGLEVTTHALSARRFKGARLSTLVSACLREDRKRRQQANQVGRSAIKSPK
jgi:hypothetical protein